MSLTCHPSSLPCAAHETHWWSSMAARHSVSSLSVTLRPAFESATTNISSRLQLPITKHSCMPSPRPWCSTSDASLRVVLERGAGSAAVAVAVAVVVVAVVAVWWRWWWERDYFGLGSNMS